MNNAKLFPFFLPLMLENNTPYRKLHHHMVLLIDIIWLIVIFLVFSSINISQLYVLYIMNNTKLFPFFLPLRLENNTAYRKLDHNIVLLTDNIWLIVLFLFFSSINTLQLYVLNIMNNTKLFPFFLPLRLENNTPYRKL